MARAARTGMIIVMIVGTAMGMAGTPMTGMGIRTATATRTVILMRTHTVMLTGILTSMTTRIPMSMIILPAAGMAIEH